MNFKLYRQFVSKIYDSVVINAIFTVCCAAALVSAAHGKHVSLDKWPILNMSKLQANSKHTIFLSANPNQVFERWNLEYRHFFQKAYLILAS